MRNKNIYGAGGVQESWEQPEGPIKGRMVATIIEQPNFFGF